MADGAMQKDALGVTVTGAVIIPHYNDTVRLRRCLEALMRHETDGTEIIVVDNGSTEPLDALIASFPTVRFVIERRKGAANARNRGVAETTAPYLFFLDSDCVPTETWLDAARAAATKADIVGGRVDVFAETPGPKSGAEAVEAVFAFDWRGYIEKKGFSVTANMLTSREIFADVGPFIDGVSEDMEWCLRARSKGYRLVAEEALQVGHPARATWKDLERKFRRITRESFMLNGTGPKARLKWGCVRWRCR